MSGGRTPRRLFNAVATVLGFARRGYFIPYRYLDQMPQAGSLPVYDALEARFAAARPVMEDLIRTMDGFAAALEAIGPDDPPEPRWNQMWFPRLDAAAAYTMVRRHAPVRIVEIGSGHSTRFLARAVRDGGLDTAITAIDPAPRASLPGPPVEVIAKPVHEAGMTPFAALGPGDFLMIDSSHILMPGSDVDYLFNRILTELPAGVFLHIHDIFLPDDYPADWAWRGYNEQQGVAALLQGRGYEILFSSRYATTRLRDALGGTVVERLALNAGAYETGLWLRKTRG